MRCRVAVATVLPRPYDSHGAMIHWTHAVPAVRPGSHGTVRLADRACHITITVSATPIPSHSETPAYMG